MTGRTFRRKTATGLAAIYAAFLLVQPVLAAGRAEGPVAKVTESTGRVSVTRPAQHRTIPVSLDLPVFLKDVVATAASSRAKLLFVDNTMLSVAPETRLVIEKYLFDADKQVQRGLVRLTTGAVKLTTSQLMGIKDRRFQIKTLTATVGVRGTEVIVIAGRGKLPAGLGKPPTRQSHRMRPIRLALAGPLGPLGPVVVAQANEPWTFVYNASLSMALVYVLLNSNPGQTLVLPPGYYVWIFAGFITMMSQLTPEQMAQLGLLFNLAFVYQLYQILNRFGQPFLPGSSLSWPLSSSSSGSHSSGGQTGGQSIRKGP
jgi:hypothetical protein